MTSIPLSRGAYERSYGREPAIKCLNRFFEENPSNQVDGVALLSRPATSSLLASGLGDGPIRSMYTLKGIFSDALFVVSGNSLYQVTTALGVIPITGSIDGGGSPRMVGRADSDGDRLFICDGTNLYYYGGNAVQATGTFTLTGNPSASDTVSVNSDQYTFVSALDSAGGSANEVLIGATASDTIDNLIAAINGAAGEGTLYGTGTVASTLITAAAASGDALTATAILAGTSGNAITTTDSGSAGAWGAGMLAGGTNGSLSTIATPGNVGIVSIDILAQHVVCVVSNSQRFYWILPGEETIDSLNFAEAEQQPDELISCRTQGDVIWFFGESSSEVWYANPNATDVTERFIRQQGQAFSRGIVEGTDVVIDNTLIVVGDDDVVYVIRGGMEAVSTPFISETIRRAEKLRRAAE